jgi:hypothetical protein
MQSTLGYLNALLRPLLSEALWFGLCIMALIIGRALYVTLVQI